MYITLTIDCVNTMILRRSKIILTNKYIYLPLKIGTYINVEKQ